MIKPTNRFDLIQDAFAELINVDDGFDEYVTAEPSPSPLIIHEQPL